MPRNFPGGPGVKTSPFKAGDAGLIPGRRCGCDGPHRSVAMQNRGREELHLAQGQGWRGRAPSCDCAGAAERSFPTPPEVRGSGPEEQPRVQGAAAARAQEGRQELPHVHGQEGRPGEDTPRPR